MGKQQMEKWQLIREQERLLREAKIARLAELRAAGVKSEPKPARKSEPDTFGRLMEPDWVQEIALTGTPAELKAIDEGRTWAAPASEILRRR